MENFLKGLEFGIYMLLLMALMFQVKHLVVDFFIQNRYPYMWMNKHNMLHPGGWLHAGSHGLWSFAIFWLMHPPFAWVELALFLCGFEVLMHFIIDYVKMNIGIRTGWKCNTSPYFWDLLGVDQFAHQVTYLAMIFIWSVNLL